MEFGSVGFYGGRKIWRTLKKNPRSKDRTKNKLNPRANQWNRIQVTEVTAMPAFLPTNVKKGGCKKKVKQRDCLNPENDMKIKKGDSTNLLHKSQIGVGGLKGNGFLCRFGLN